MTTTAPHPSAERRSIPKPVTGLKIERRADEQPVLIGYAAVFYRADDPGTEFEMWPGAVERIMPGAYDSALSRPDDVRALFNHDTDHVLGRTSAGTLRLSVDAVGLRYEIDMPETQFARDLAASIERGDISGSSFSFRDLKRTWIDDTSTPLEIREVHDVELFDVGPVTFPAYDAASVSVAKRSRELASEERRSVEREASRRKRRRRLAQLRRR